MYKYIEKGPKFDLTGQVKVDRMFEISTKYKEMMQKTFSPYVHWEQIKFWEMPNGLSNEELWSTIKFFRTKVYLQKKTFINSEKGDVFYWLSLPNLEKFLHEIDLNMGGSIFSTDQINFDDKFKNKILASGIMEEAIASSQLEGAHTSRKVAKQMLLEGRKPKNNDEQMIINGHNLLKYIESNLAQKDINAETLLNLHKITTENTDIDKEAVGRFRKAEENVQVVDGASGLIYHTAPNIIFLNQELNNFFEYFNDKKIDAEFTHPLVKAILIHFWFAYLHPFVDGNGRLARALFYWYLIKNKYWAFAYVPISTVIKNAPGQYRDAYMYAEQDDCDLSYFIDFNINKIKKATQDFEKYVDKKIIENKEVSRFAKNTIGLNERQVSLLKSFNTETNFSITQKVYQNLFGISRVTAHSDIQVLLKQKLLLETRKKNGKFYFPTEKVANLFKVGM